MAIEPRRGCGFRKIGGLYLVTDGMGEGCHKLPVPLHVCPTCNTGLKQRRGWQWVDGAVLFANSEVLCVEPEHCPRCPMCSPHLLGRCGLVWVGTQFYKTPAEFTEEAVRLGVSRRISTLPRGFVLGETYVLVAHPKAVPEHFETVAGAEIKVAASAGVFHGFKPQRLELIIKQSEATPEKIEELAKRGITAVPVPDNDPDHQGSVYDKPDEEELPLDGDDAPR